jgi:hypothetical protein
LYGLDQIDQIIGFTIASGSISSHYGDGTYDGTPADKNRRQDGRQYKSNARKSGRKSKKLKEDIKPTNYQSEPRL